MNYSKFGKIPMTSNKFWEVEVYYYPKSSDIFELNFNLTRRCDHAGLDFLFGILGASLHISIYDNRHWDHENDTWVVYDEAYFLKQQGEIYDKR